MCGKGSVIHPKEVVDKQEDEEAKVAMWHLADLTVVNIVAS